MYCFLQGSLSILVCCIVSPAQVFAQVPASQTRVEFRLAEMEPGPGLTPAQVDRPRQLVYLHKQVVITHSDITEARALEESNAFGLYEVLVVFTKKGADRMAEATKTRKSLLALLIDGKAVAVMGIPHQIQDSARISGPMTKKEAENLAATLTKAASIK